MKWEFKLNLTTLLLIAAGVIVFFLFQHKAKKWNNDIDRWRENYYSQVEEFETYRSRVDDAIVAKDELIKLREKELRQWMKSDSIQRELVKKYKRLSASIQIETVFIHDTIEVEVPIIIEKDTTLELWHDCFDIDLSLSTGRLSVDMIDIQNRQDIVLGERKNGLRKAEYALDIRNSNQCVTTTGISSFIVVHEKKWWENPLIVAPSSFLIGFTAAKLSQ